MSNLSLDQMLLTVLVFISTITLILFLVFTWMLRKIERNIDSFLTEFREKSNSHERSLDHNFAEITGEIKKVSNRLDSISRELHQNFIEKGK